MPVVWDDERVVARTVIFEDDMYKMWFHGQNEQKRQIGYATSPDGINWTKHENNPILQTGPNGSWDDQHIGHPVVISGPDKFQMWYVASHNYFWRTCFATSVDGITWEKFKHNPVIDVGIYPDWDFKEFWPSTVIFEDSVYKMWCSGLQDNYAIGYATAPVNIHVPADQPTIQAGIDSAKDGEVVLVDEGTYYENISFKGKKITVASHYLVDKDTSHISQTIIDGSQNQNPDSGSVVYFVSGEDTNSILCGFTITGGSGTKNFWEENEMRTGGGISIWNSGAKIIKNYIINNKIDLVQTNIYCHGGGMDIFGFQDQTIYISENIIRNNSVNSWWGGGAGIVMGTAGNLLFDKNIVANNTFTSQNLGGGGGFYIWADDEFNGMITLKENFIYGNSVTGGSHGNGGGIYLENSSTLFFNNVIFNNISNSGGGGV